MTGIRERIFLQFYILPLVTILAVAWLAEALIGIALEQMTDENIRTTVAVLENEFERTPQAQWPNELRELESEVPYKLELVKLADLKLRPEERTQLAEGKSLHVGGERLVYRELPGGEMVLVVGPLEAASNLKQGGHLSAGLRVRLIVFVIVAIVFAAVAYLWLRPIWRDLIAARKTALALAAGNFQARTPSARSQVMVPLATTLNSMANRIQRLIVGQKELARAVSHELRTPISRLRFALELIEGEPDSHARAEILRGMKGDLAELDALINTSLTYARFERESPLIDPQSGTFGPWFVEQVEAMRLMAGGVALNVELSSGAEDARVEFDKNYMPYAIRNIVRNALKYADSRVVARAALDGENIVVQVDDDGPGVPVEERERIFEAFTRLDRSRDRSSGGFGLGLAIARRILTLHGGVAECSESPLGGARFSLRWPTRQKRARAAFAS